MEREISNVRHLNNYFIKDSPEGDYPASSDVIRETNELYLRHLMTEIRRVGLEPPQLGSSETGGYSSSRRFRSLRSMADRFENSQQRRWVREQAQNVDLDSLNAHTFQELLSGLFEQGGITCERVLVLFYFCADLSIRALQEKISGYFLQIYFWTTCYISGRLAFWIEKQGGWAALLPGSVGYLSFNWSYAGMFIIGILATCFFMRNFKK
ncbi:unnamed protein product [Brassicogethes aeneus]|uniref:Bcl-2 Bcl-2 homology region 1-3 domain-containing protein n=1 Tax=Brassicogethes aeneus TaxID=1431903 RepID=A0A9P0AXV3_BRAAE|nr:unnamed protein product [Brassicogethes aeneus]